MRHAILIMAHDDIEYLSGLIDYFDSDLKNIKPIGAGLIF